MKPTNEVKMQIGLMATVLLLSVGIAFAGQWMFDKCFAEKPEESEKVQPKSQCDTLNQKDSIYMQKSLMQKQK